ncbi:MAG: DUF7024 domain-containing protein [Spirulina sp.]
MVEKKNDNTKPHTFLIAIAIATAFLLIFRSLGLYPGVMGDEYLHSISSRLLPFNAMIYPEYLYYSIYRTTRMCGDGFLECARVLNAVFFVSSAPFIYLISRKVTDKRTSLLIAALSILGPINSYTAYFMPESLFFLFFWVFTWLVLSMSPKHGIWNWLSLGLFFGLTSLVKPHALFLLPSLVVFFAFQKHDHQHNSEVSFRKKLRLYSAFFASAIATKFLIGFILAGEAGLTLFGTYESQAPAGQSLDDYVNIFKLFLENIRGHFLGLSLLFSVPIAQILSSSIFSLKQQSDRGSSINVVNIILYALSIFVFIIPIAALYTGSIAYAYPDYQSNLRLHMRYYNFAFPLFIIVGASRIFWKDISSSFKSRAITAVLIGIAILYAVITGLIPYEPSTVDNPELRGIIANYTVFYILSGFSLGSLILWVYSAQKGAKLFVYVFMPLVVTFSGFHINQDLRQNNLMPREFLAYDVGIMTKQYLYSEDLTKLQVVGSELLRLYGASFYLDHASFEVIPKDSKYDLSTLPVGKEWVLVLGDHSLSTNDDLFQIPMNNATLVHVPNPGSAEIDFNRTSWPGIIFKTQGLGYPAGWGRWSSGNVVTLEFVQPLPEKFTVHLLAHSHGPNVQKDGDYAIHIEDSTVKFKLGESTEEKVFKFSNPTQYKTIRIDIPLTTLPQNSGEVGEDKRIGMALIKMRITAL